MFRARSRWRWPARRRKVSGDVARDSRESASIGNHSGESSPPPAWHIFAALSATVLGFAGSILFSHHIASRIDDDAVSIATDASPAIQHLTMARTEVLRIQLAAAVAIENAAEGVPLDRAPFASSLARLHGELSAYLTLPLYPRERDYYNEADQATHTLEAQVSDLCAHLLDGDRVGAIATLRNGLSPAASSTDDALERLVTFNAEQQTRLGMAIPKLRAHAARIGFVLEAVTVVLGLVLMTLVWRAIRRRTRLLAEQKRLTEENADRVAAFDARLELLIASSVKIFEAITTDHDLHKIFQVIVDEARPVVNAEFCALGRGTDPERPFDPWISSGMPTAIARSLGRPPRPVGLLGAVITEGHLIRLAELKSHPAFRGLPAGHPMIGPFIGIPIVRDGSNVGNLYLARKEGQPAFDDDDERAAELFAACIGVAVGNARLYNQALDATRAREDLLATVSHDLRNPLNAIRMATELLRKTVGESRGGELAARIERASQRMLRLISDLLDASKIEAGVLRTAGKPEDVASLVNSAVDMFSPAATEKSIRLCPAAPSRQLAVLCERDLILRVFSNLIGNAIKFSPNGASISVVAEELSGQVHFSVADTGPGIPAEHLPHAFDRYWQQKDSDRRGSGLGLYIAKGIVDAHHGRIWITSTPGRGTTVHFTLPLAPGREDSASLPT